MSDHNEKYNPFEDKGIKISHQEKHDVEDTREGFNDVMKHYDIVNGHHIPKQVEHFPKRTRGIVRIFAALYVLLFVGFILYGFIRNIIDLVRSVGE